MTSERFLTGRRVERARVGRPTVEGHLIVRLIVDSLDDIDLSGRWPVRSE